MNDALAPLRHRAFRYVAGGRLVVMLGNAIAPVALAFAVLDLTGSAADLGLVVGARSLMNVVFVLFGGIVADRLPRHLVLVASCSVAALSQAAVATLVLTDRATIPLLLALSAVNGISSAFAFPAAAAIIPQTVPVELLRAANAINRLGTSGAMIVGAGLGGVLVASIGPGWGLAVDAVTFAVGAALFAVVRVPGRRAAGEPRTTLLHDLRTGWTEFASRSWVWVVVLGFCFSNMAFVAAISVLGPVVADETIGRRLWGVVLGAETLGMVVGALVAMRVRVRRLLLFGVVCSGGDLLLVLALGVAPHIAVLVPAAFLTGVAVEQFAIAWEVSMQEHIPADTLARVYSYDMLGSFLAIPIGQVAAGPVAERVGAPVGAGRLGGRDRPGHRGHAGQPRGPHARAPAEGRRNLTGAGVRRVGQEGPPPLGPWRPRGLGNNGRVNSANIPNVLAARYASAELVRIWSPEEKVRAERRLWIAVLTAQRDLGVPVPDGVVEAYEAVVDQVDLASIAARERVTRHDVKARIEEFAALAGHEQVHKGMTSRDLTENVEQMQIRDSLLLVRDRSSPPWPGWPPGRWSSTTW